MASWSPRARTRTPICSGECAAAAVTSASSRRSSSACTRSGRSCSPGRSSTIWTMPAEVLRFYREFAATAPDELTTIVELELAPPLPFLPEDVHGKPIVMVAACYAGPPEAGAEIVRPLREFGNPIADLLEPKPYLALQSMFDPWFRTAGTATGNRSSCRRSRTMRSTRSSRTPRGSRRHARTPSSSSSAARSRRVAEDATAFGQRDAAHNVVINAVWTEDDPEGTPAHRLGARPLRRPAAPRARPRLRQLSRRRGTRPRSTGLRDREVRPAGGAQTQVRPHQLLPPQPEHPAVRGLRAGASRGRGTPSTLHLEPRRGLRLALRVTSSRRTREEAHSLGRCRDRHAFVPEASLTETGTSKPSCVRYASRSSAKRE